MDVLTYAEGSGQPAAAHHGIQIKRMTLPRKAPFLSTGFASGLAVGFAGILHGVITIVFTLSTG
jgi:hypothetical protein